MSFFYIFQPLHGNLLAVRPPYRYISLKHEMQPNIYLFGFSKFHGPLIPVVINMFRLPDFLTGDNITFNRLKLLQT